MSNLPESRREFCAGPQSSLPRRPMARKCGGIRALPAIKPIQRNSGVAKFKFSLAAYSYRDLLTSKPPKLSLDEDFISDCAKMGLEGTELTSYYFPQPVTPEYLCKLKDHAFRLGLDISGTAVGNDFCFRRRRAISSCNWSNAGSTMPRSSARHGDPHFLRQRSARPGLPGRSPQAGGRRHGRVLPIRRHAWRAFGIKKPRWLDQSSRRNAGASPRSKAPGSA